MMGHQCVYGVDLYLTPFHLFPLLSYLLLPPLHFLSGTVILSNLAFVIQTSILSVHLHVLSLTVNL